MGQVSNQGYFPKGEIIGADTPGKVKTKYQKEELNTKKQSYQGKIFIFFHLKKEFALKSQKQRVKKSFDFKK